MEVQKTEAIHPLKSNGTKEKLAGKQGESLNIFLFFLVYDFTIIIFHGCLRRHLCPLDDKDTDEEVCRRSRRCRPERTLEKMQSDWLRMKDHLSALRQVRMSPTGYFKSVF